MIDWSRGITAKYYASIVDPSTWRDTSSIDIISGSIKYTNSGVRGSADLECATIDHDKEYWIRIYLEAKQGGIGELIPLFTGIASIPDISYNGRFHNSKVQCYSSLSPAEKIYLPLGWFARAGSSGGTVIKDLLSEYSPAPLIIDDGSPALIQDVISEKNETRLSMVDKILEAINWRIVLLGDGTIRVTPKETDVISASFDHEINDMFEMNVSVSNNWYDIPNVYRAVGSGISSVAKDEDPNSKFSIPSRGREIWMQETDCILNNGEKISQYASRKLKEAQIVYKSVNYTRRFEPNIYVSDKVYLNYPEQNITGYFTIESQDINLSYGGQVSEQVKGGAL